MAEEDILEKERFCINCGIWFNDDKMVCPNCNQVKVSTAATRIKKEQEFDAATRKVMKAEGLEKTVVVIVGPDGTKLTENDERDARQECAWIFKSYEGQDIEYASGGASGIDSISDEVATGLGIPKHKGHPFKPAKGHEHWPQKGDCPLGGNCYGFKARNMKLAEVGTVFYCVVPRREKPNRPCYHCNTKDHDVSGGCFTIRQAEKQGKEVHLRFIGLR